MNRHTSIVSVGKFWLLSITLLTCQLANGDELPQKRTDILNSSRRNQEVLLRGLRPAMKTTPGAGRLYIQSECLGDSGSLLFVPRIELKSVGNGQAGSTAIQEVLAKNKNVRVAERGPEVIGIWIGDVSNDLLSTKIHMLKLEPRQMYNYYEAIAAIIDAKEVQARMRELKMDEFTSFASYPILDPDPKLRHLPAFLTNVTMDEALDHVARAFGGLVIYKECHGNNRKRFAIDFDAIAESPFKKVR